MSQTPNFDKRITDILAATKPGERVCALTGQKWNMTEEEIGWFRKFNVPPSPFAPQVRLWHLSAYFTVYQWWWNKHFDTGAPVLTCVHPASGLRVLPDKEWFARDFTSTGREYDAQQPFFGQWRELQLSVPLNATRNMVEPENSVTVISFGDKDSLFVSGCRSKNGIYLLDCVECENCVDCLALVNGTDCYRCIHSSRLHNCKFVLESYDCIGSSFLFDCRNCENCFGATNKRNKKFLFFNEQLSESAWRERVAQMNLGDAGVLVEVQSRFRELVQKAIWPESFNEKCENSTGDYMIRCTNCVNTFYGIDGLDNYWCYGAYNARGNAFACAVNSNDCYQTGPDGNCAGTKFSFTMVRCDDVEYSSNCYDCTHCFGCVGLSKKKFHIFNHPYPEDEYWQRVDELKCAMLDRGEYGLPMPMAYSFSYFPESGVVMYLGADVSEWDRTGMKRFEAGDEGAFGNVRLEGKSVRGREEVPATISALDDSWINVPIMDPDIKRPFTFLKPEVAFYRQHNIAPPRQHFTARMRDLLFMSNSGQLEDSSCASCGKALRVATNRTTPQRQIYCRACYLKYLEKYG